MAARKKKIVIPETALVKEAPEPSMMEKAMAMLMTVTAENTKILTKVADSLENLDKKFDGPAFSKDHQIDLDQENKMNPFQMKYIYKVEQRGQDLWDGMWDYEDNAGKVFHQRDEAVRFGQDHYWVWMYRILQVEAPMST